MLRMLKTLFFAVFAVIGLALSGYSIAALYHARQSESWPAAAGRMLEAECRSAGSRPATRVRIVKYTYAVSAAAFSGEREYFGIRIASNNCTAGYRENQNVTVYYDPADPADSVLERGAYRAAAYGLAAGIIFIAFGLGGYFLDRKKNA